MIQNTTLQNEIEKLKDELTSLNKKQYELETRQEVSVEERVNSKVLEHRVKELETERLNSKSLELKVKELEKENVEQKLKYNTDTNNLKIISQEEVHELKLKNLQDVSDLKLKHVSENMLNWKSAMKCVLNNIDLKTIFYFLNNNRLVTFFMFIIFGIISVFIKFW